MLERSQGQLEHGAATPNLVGKGKGEKRSGWEEQLQFFRKDKWIFRTTEVGKLLIMLSLQV